MQKLVQDLRFAVRQMARTPGFSLTAILSLALGIGATVSVFSVIYSAVLNAWPPGMRSNISGCRRFSAAFSCPRTHLTRKILNRWQS